MPKTSAPIRRAVVQAVRAAPAYSSLKGIFNGFAPEKTEYPFAVYNQIAAPYEDDWSSRMIVSAFDVFVFSRNEVEANSLDQSLADALNGAQLTVEDQTALICRRVNDIPVSPDVRRGGEEDLSGRRDVRSLDRPTPYRCLKVRPRVTAARRVS